MTNALLEKMILEEAKDLAPETLEEILDFIQFKKLRASVRESYQSEIKKELSDLGEVSLIHLEKEFAYYQELYPRE